MKNRDGSSFTLTEEGLFLLQDGNKARITNYIKIINIIINKNTDIETYELEYLRRNTNEFDQKIYKKITYFLCLSMV